MGGQGAVVVAAVVVVGRETSYYKASVCMWHGDTSCMWLHHDVAHCWAKQPPRKNWPVVLSRIHLAIGSTDVHMMNTNTHRALLGRVELLGRVHLAPGTAFYVPPKIP